jgi:hypothetical protein
MMRTGILSEINLILEPQLHNCVMKELAANLSQRM